MKQNVSTPAIIAGVVAVLLAVAILFLRGVAAEPHTPRPDPSMFAPKTSNPPAK